MKDHYLVINCGMLIASVGVGFKYGLASGFIVAGCLLVLVGIVSLLFDYLERN